MKTITNRWWWLLALAGSVASAAILQAQEGPKTIVLGANLSDPQRGAVLERIAADEAVDTLLTISPGETAGLLQGVVPVSEGYSAISSVSVACGAPGSGLHVTTENLQRVAAATFGGALLAAGVGDARLLVVAPPDAPTDGTTALAALFKAFNAGACGRGEIEPARRDLALDWLATATALGDTIGNHHAASQVLLNAHHGLITGGQSDPAAVEPALDNAIAATGVAVPPEQRPAVLEWLLRIAVTRPDWGAYAPGWEFQDPAPTEARLLPFGAPSSGSTSVEIAGTVREAAGPGSPLVIEAPGQTQQLNLRVSDVAVTRDGLPSRLADLRPGDNLTIEVGVDGVVRRIEALSGAAAGSEFGSIVVGTVNQNTEGQLLVMTASGEQEFTVPSGAAIVRDGRQTQIAAVAANDSAVILLDPDGAVVSVFARPLGNSYVVEGRTTGLLREHVLELAVGDRSLYVPLPQPGQFRVLRDGEQATLAQIQPEDQVAIRFDRSGNPTEVVAQTLQQQGIMSYIDRYRWWGLLCLVPLLLMIPLIFAQGRADRTPLVLPGRRRAIEPDDFDGVRRR